MNTAEKIWAEHLASHQAGKGAGGGGGMTYVPRPGDWPCPKCWPKVNNFAFKHVCFKCGTPKPEGGALVEPTKPQAPAGINFGIRGDSLLQTRHDSAKLKKYRNFKPDFETAFWNVFGNCTLDHDISAGEKVREVAVKIANGPAFDILCVGIGIQDLMDPNEWNKILPFYPPSLDQELECLAAAIKSKANGSMVWVGGPAEFWGRGDRWDSYMAHARNTLRKSGIQVVPSETATFVFQQLTLANDEAHIANLDHEKEAFAKAWATCLYAAAADPTWGTAVADEPNSMEIRFAEGSPASMQALSNAAPQGRPGRSRSPPRQAQGQARPFNPFAAKGYRSSFVAQLP